MALTLYFHPLSSFCQKALIALYENGTPFTPKKVDLMDETESAAFKQMWPIGKFPVLGDDKKGTIIPESTSIIEYLAQHYPGSVQLVPKDAGQAFTVRAQDRFGSIRKGLEADLLLVDGNPLQDISATERISTVFFKGERVNRADLFDQK